MPGSDALFAGGGGGNGIRWVLCRAAFCVCFLCLQPGRSAADLATQRAGVGIASSSSLCGPPLAAHVAILASEQSRCLAWHNLAALVAALRPAVAAAATAASAAAAGRWFVFPAQAKTRLRLPLPACLRSPAAAWSGTPRTTPLWLRLAASAVSAARGAMHQHCGDACVPDSWQP